MLKNLLGYEVITLLGESMHAEVCKAHFKGSPPNDFVVVKKIKPKFCNRGLYNYLQQQVKYLLELDLVGCIKPIIESPSHDQLYLIQPWVEGYTLEKWLTEQTQFNLAKFLKIIIAIAEQIEERHKAGFIHKSIKPTNILIQKDTLKVQIIDDVRILDINQISHFIYQHCFFYHLKIFCC